MSECIRILHVEDVEDDALLILRVIQKAGIDVCHKRIETKQAMVDALDSEEWDVILADYHLPHFGALEALTTLQEADLDLPFMIVSGTIGEEVAVEAMRAGAHDYIMKDNLARLPSVIRRELTDARSRAEKRQNTHALFESEQQLRNKVAQQNATLAIGQAVQEMTKPEDLGNVARVCFDQFQALGLNFLAIAIQRMIDPVNGVFAFYEIQPSGTFHQFIRQSENLFKKWRLGDTVYRPNLDQNMGGLTPEDHHRISMRYGRRVNSILNICFDKGVLSLLSDQVDPFNQEQISFLEQGVLPISIGMHRLQDMEQLDAVVRHLPEGICLLDNLNHLVFANTLGKNHLTELGIHAQDDAPIEIDGLSVERLYETTKELPHQVRLSNESGTVLDIIVKPVREGRDVSSGWVVVFRDVTQELQAATASQRQDRLASIGQMAAGIAHDLNNMLTVMSGFAQILEMNPDLDGQTKEDLAQISEQGQRGAKLIRQILDFSRNIDVERQPLDILPLLKESVKLFQRTLPENISVVDEFSAEDYTVLTNVTQLQQVLNNLAVNARDAMPDGGKIVFGAQHLNIDHTLSPPVAEMGEGHWLKLTVTDTGSGMTREILDHVFEPFFTTKDVGSGTGLGLSQVYGLVMKHDGFIDIESTVGKGTTVSMYFPLVEVDVLDNRVTDEMPSGNGETILVVEDNDSVLESVKKMLTYLNYTVRAAHSVDEALAIVSDPDMGIDAVLTDLVMPGQSGLDLFENMRARGFDMPLTVMTGYPSEVQRFEAYITKTSGVILKPLDMSVVAAQVNTMLQSASM